jgi:glycosyltransferase involved in cell wall biosynthesis
MITVIFATRNGMRTLPSVLDAYLRLQVPDRGWKLIVVDNASTDRSRDAIDSFQDRLPLTSLSEKKPGKNAALNAALAHIEGDLVVLTDDDVFPRPDWLACMRAAADNQPAYSIFGGVVVPRWEITPPDWVMKWVPLEPVFTLTPPSLREGPVDHHFVFGPNMAVRAKVFEEGFRFDPTIGPQGSNYAMGSETEFVNRLASQGHTAWHVRNAQVEHFIRDFQMTSSWIMGRAIRFGRGLYRVGSKEQSTELPTWLGVPRYLFKEMLRQSALLSKNLLTFHSEAAFRARWDLNVVRGQIIESYRSGRRPTEGASGVGQKRGRT